MKKTNKFKNGQAIAEYLILTALIAIASIGIIQVISRNLRGKLDQVNAAVLGEKKEFDGIKDTTRQTKMVDMGDFNETLTDTGKDKN
jgi:Flp pilus assembly pilin Flp